MAHYSSLKFEGSQEDYAIKLSITQAFLLCPKCLANVMIIRLQVSVKATKFGVEQPHFILVIENCRRASQLTKYQKYGAMQSLTSLKTTEQ